MSLRDQPWHIYRDFRRRSYIVVIKYGDHTRKFFRAPTKKKAARWLENYLRAIEEAVCAHLASVAARAEPEDELEEEAN